MIDGVINNGRKGEELEAAKGEARRTSPEKKPSIRKLLSTLKDKAAALNAQRDKVKKKDREVSL